MRIVVYLGTGGVGKTSLSAATALDWARRGHPSIVLTTDPARRLRDALGLADSGVEQPVPLDPPAPAGLWGAVLDVRATLEHAVRLHGNADEVPRILNHPIFATIANALPGMQELMAVERMDQLMRAGFRNFVIDTAPSRHALEFLDKPELFSGFAGSGWVKLAGRTYRLAAASPAGWFGKASLQLYTQVETLLGADLVRQILDFYSIFMKIAEGYADRARATLALLKDPAISEFRIVSTPGKAEADSAYFAAELSRRGFPVGAVCVNRVWRHARRDDIAPPAAGLARELLEWYESVQQDQQASLQRLLNSRPTSAAPVRWLPELDEDAGGLASLELIRQAMQAWDGAE